VQVAGSTAIGAVADAAVNVPALNPLEVTDAYQSTLGLGLCGIGGVSGVFPKTWTLRVDHLTSDLGGTSFQLSKGDDLMWLFGEQSCDPSFNCTSGPELTIEAPARTKPGVPFTVSVFELGEHFNSASQRIRNVPTPAVGAIVNGASAPVDASGQTQVTFSASGGLAAIKAGDIPSPTIPVCVAAKLKRCPLKAGLPIFGSEAADDIDGTAGDDAIKAGGGDDGIFARLGGRDSIQCGAGADFVKADAKDKVDKASCEKVKRFGKSKHKRRKGRKK
jgi:hypothetical protein